MSRERLFLDTVFIQAMLSQRDQHHPRARILMPRVRTAAEVWLTEAVLIEVGNGMSAIDRPSAVQFIRQLYEAPNTWIVSVDTTLLNRGLNLYQARQDKQWGLTDCISFVVMQDQGLTDAVTADEHFVQAGYRALLLDN